MKKLTIVLAAVALAGAAMATCSFTVQNASAYNGYNVYAIGSSSSADSSAAAKEVKADIAEGGYDDFLIGDSALEGSGCSTWAAYYASCKYTSDSAAIAGGTATVGMTDNSTTIAFLLVKGDFACGHEYVILDPISATSSSDGNYVFDLSNATIMTDGDGRELKGYLRTDAVPEPTGGLLMLVGMAGLALRRRRM